MVRAKTTFSQVLSPMIKVFTLHFVQTLTCLNLQISVNDENVIQM